MMNRIIRTAAAIGLVSIAFQVRLAAAPKGVKPSKPAMAATPKPGKPVSSPVMKTTTAKGGGHQIKSPKATTGSAAKAPKHSTRTATSTTSGAGSATSTPPFATNVSNPLADKISRKPNLAAKIASRLPADMTLAQASTGFRNQGQFIAAVNVSRNLGIDFVRLQTAMTGQTVSVNPKTHAITTTPTGDAPLSLGRAIQTLRPGTDADAAVQKAHAQTSQMVQ